MFDGWGLIMLIMLSKPAVPAWVLRRGGFRAAKNPLLAVFESVQSLIYTLPALQKGLGALLPPAGGLGVGRAILTPLVSPAKGITFVKLHHIYCLDGIARPEG